MKLSLSFLRTISTLRLKPTLWSQLLITVAEQYEPSPASYFVILSRAFVCQVSDEDLDSSPVEQTSHSYYFKTLSSASGLEH
jgi:hypothetical protein